VRAPHAFQAGGPLQGSEVIGLDVDECGRYLRVPYILGYKGRGQSVHASRSVVKVGPGLARTSAGLVSIKIRCAIPGK
jgi:hypothetical protein